jgi:hypothetical protein
MSEEVSRIEELEEALKVVLCALCAATSILDRADLAGRRPSKVVGSNMMFIQMLKDYANAEITGRKALTRSPPKQGKDT